MKNPGEPKIALLRIMESSQGSEYREKLQLNGSENFPDELQITLQLGSRWAFEVSY